MPKVNYQGTPVADSDAVERVEGTLYFPRADVDMERLSPSTTAYTCPWKGDTQYFHLRIGDTQLDDAAWSYPDPKPAARDIAGHIAFDVGQGLELQ